MPDHDRRRRLLEAFALIEPCARDSRALAPDADDQPHLRLTMDGGKLGQVSETTETLRGVA